jgi:hypothetical protein
MIQIIAYKFKNNTIFSIVFFFYRIDSRKLEVEEEFLAKERNFNVDLYFGPVFFANF